jgi:hypothetical protein
VCLTRRHIESPNSIDIPTFIKSVVAGGLMESSMGVAEPPIMLARHHGLIVVGDELTQRLRRPAKNTAY